MAAEPTRTEGLVRSTDGVEIAFTTAGTRDGGPATLVFIHGGLADSAFWGPQLASLSRSYRVVALDLGGHGESGQGRKAWTIPAFAEDVRAVVEALDLRNAVLVGNSLGGLVALDAARLLRGRVIGVVGVDTLHDGTQTFPEKESRERADAFRKDFVGSCHAMAEALFHPGTHPELRAWVKRRMRAAPPEVAAGMMEGFAGYDLPGAFRGAGVPIRAINGDLWPTRISANRALAPGFDAVIMTGCGHYPMLERPDEFNRHLVEVVAGLTRAAAGGEPPA